MLDGCGRRILCARAYNDPAPAEDTVFDGAQVGADGTRWHSLVYTHRKQQATLYLDGVAVQTVTSFTYPREGACRDAGAPRTVERTDTWSSDRRGWQGCATANAP